MKSILIILFIISRITANELSWVDEQVNAIKPNRNGVSNQSISKLRNPFIYLTKNGAKKAEKDISTNTPKNTISSSEQTTSTSSQSVLQTIKKIATGSNFTLSAIINSTALINGQWYKRGDKINGYDVSNITTTTVSLKKNNKITKLSTKSTITKLKFK